MITFFENGEKKPSLKTVQDLVDGYVELINIPNKPDWQMLVNEDGRMKQLPYNEEASALCGRPIVGHAVILKGDARLT